MGAQPQTASAAVSSQLQTNIANLAYANKGKTCGAKNSLGGTGFSSNGYYSCNYEWCSIFSGWVWHYADARIEVAGLKTDARDFYTYGTTHGTVSTTPHKGDAVVFVNVKGGGAADIHHVGIVYKVNSDGTINYLGGNETPPSGPPSIVGYDLIKSAIGSQTSGGGQWLYSYISPVLMAPTGLYVTLSNPADGQVSFSWQMAYNPGSFTVSRTSSGTTIILATNLAGTKRQIYDYTTHGTTYTYKVCAVTDGISSCSSISYKAS